MSTPVQHDPLHPPCARPAPLPSQETLGSILTHLWETSWNGHVTLHFQRGLPRVIEWGRRRVKIG